MIRRLLPEKTVERLSEYRRTLLKCMEEGKNYIYSHELAQIHNITPVQVRRDIMFISFSSFHRKGYNVKELADAISKILDPEPFLNVAVVGLGNLGKAITAYFAGKRPHLNLVAAFDIDPQKFNTTIGNVKCYPMERLNDLIRNLNISIAILTVPPDVAQATAQQLVNAGIKGILNFTSVTLKLPENVMHVDYDMVTSIEKLAYYVKNSTNQ